jgi:Peptidase family M23
VRRVRLLGIGVAIAALVAGTLVGFAPAAGAATARNVYTPVLASLLSPNNPSPVLGTDRTYHVLYELRLANRGPIPATVQHIEVFDPDSRETVRTFEGIDLQARLRDTAGRSTVDAVIEPGGERLFLADLSFDLSLNVPLALGHRLNLLAPRTPRAAAPSNISYSAVTISLDGPAPPVIVPPVRGNGWVVTNGCCDIGNVDRTTVLPVNGGLWSPLRFAIDLMQLDDDGLFVNGDPAELTNFTNYGADVLSVAPGRVAALLDSLQDFPAGVVPDPSAATFESADGNYVVIDHGNGMYAFYGNLQPGSLTVEVGDRVQRREVLATIGNSGPGSFPHLHFRLMTSPSPFGSDGLPFVLNAFGYEGQVDAAQFAAEGVVGNYLGSRSPNPDSRRRELPLGLAIIDFGAAGGAGAVGRT